jgi:hypothetical protein
VDRFKTRALSLAKIESATVVFPSPMSSARSMPFPNSPFASYLSIWFQYDTSSTGRSIDSVGKGFIIHQGPHTGGRKDLDKHDVSAKVLLQPYLPEKIYLDG